MFFEQVNDDPVLVESLTELGNSDFSFIYGRNRGQGARTEVKLRRVVGH